MRLRPIHWFLLSLLLFAAGAYVWHRADKWQEEKNRAREKNLQPSPAPSSRKDSSNRAATVQTTPPPMPLLSAAAPLSSVPDKPAKRDPRFPYRVSNTAKTVGQLARSETGLLLENALIDTSLKTSCKSRIRSVPKASTAVTLSKRAARLTRASVSC